MTSGGIARRLDMTTSRYLRPSLGSPLPGSRESERLGKSWIPAILLMILLLPGYAVCAQITIDSDQQFRFAEQTMEKGEYPRAVVEFERFLQFFPEDKKVPKAKLLIAQCYLKGRDYESARKSLSETLSAYRGTLVGGKAMFLMGESYYEQGLYEEAERYFKGVVAAYAEPELRNSAIYRLGWIQMQTGKWHEASETFKAVGAGSPLFPNAQDLSFREPWRGVLALQRPHDRRRPIGCAGTWALLL